MTPDYVAIILSLPIVYLLFRFASRPTYKMLSAFLTLSNGKVVAALGPGGQFEQRLRAAPAG